ncbi:hypothetical protein V6Z12_A05G146300 [Gossypium hirsutum]
MNLRKQQARSYIYLDKAYSLVSTTTPKLYGNLHRKKPLRIYKVQCLCMQMSDLRCYVDHPRANCCPRRIWISNPMQPFERVTQFAKENRYRSYHNLLFEGEKNKCNLSDIKEPY